MSEYGHVGSGGNHGQVRDLLDEAAAQLDLDPVSNDDPVVLRSAAQEYRDRTAKAIELEDAAAELREAERRAAIVRRRIARAQRSTEKAVEREVRREAGGLYAGEPRSPNRAVHVEVDVEAWETVKAEAIRQRRAVAAVVGELVANAVDRPVLPQREPQRAPQRGPSAMPARRFARLFIGDDLWAAFRAAASRGEVSAARAVGLVVESEARRLGWRRAPDD